MGPRDGPKVLEKRKISCLYRDFNPGPSSPLPTRSTDYDIPVPAVRNFEVQWEGLKTGKLCKGKDKGKFHPRTGHEGPEVEQRYSSTLSLT